MPYYVVGKDMTKNEVYVTTDLDDSRLWSKSLKLTAPNWINGEPDVSRKLQVRTRYRAPLVNITNITKLTDTTWEIELAEEVRAVTPGQSAVLYSADHCLGGGIVV